MSSTAKESESEKYDTSSGTFIERFIGLIAVSIFTSCFYYCIIYQILLVVAVIKYGFNQYTLLAALPLILSLILPTFQCPQLLNTKFFRCALKYFDFEEIQEISDEEFVELSKKKHFIIACQPHGVLSVAGICLGIHKAPERLPPTAVASVLLRIPIMRHLFGMYNLIDASKKTVTRALKKGSVVIYIGGMAELFLSNPEEERLYIANRKGFIKIAMQTGSDVIPSYFFGNTSTLQVIRGSILQTLSRSIGVSITLFWGRWCLPLPMPRKILCVRGRPLGIPKIENPTNEEIDTWHRKYLQEVIRLFDTYKAKVPDYKHKTLIMDSAEDKKSK